MVLFDTPSKFSSKPIAVKKFNLLSFNSSKTLSKSVTTSGKIVSFSFPSSPSSPSSARSKFSTICPFFI